MPEIQKEKQELIIKFLLSIATRFQNESSPPHLGLSKDPTNRYIKKITTLTTTAATTTTDAINSV